MLSSHDHPAAPRAAGGPQARIRLAGTIALSVALHACAGVLAWRAASMPAPGPAVALVRLAAAEFEPAPREGRPTGSEAPGAPPPAIPSGDPGADVEPAAPLLGRDAEDAATARQIASLEAAHAALAGQLETLTAEKGELGARLEAERERAARLEQQLHETLAAERAALDSVRAAHDQLVSALHAEIAEKTVALSQARERLTVTIMDRVLFPSGQAGLTLEGRRLVGKVAGILDKIEDRRILIEGHTDSVPVGPELQARFPTNWELSTARATEVVKHLVTHAGVPAERLSASGRADTAPVASNLTEAGRRQNRRIEIILLPAEGESAG